MVGVSKDPAESVNARRNAERMLGAMRGRVTLASVPRTPDPDALLTSSRVVSMLRMAAETIR